MKKVLGFFSIILTIFFVCLIIVLRIFSNENVEAANYNSNKDTTKSQHGLRDATPEEVIKELINSGYFDDFEEVTKLNEEEYINRLYDESDKRLKDMSDDEAYELLLNIGLVFPEAYNNADETLKKEITLRHIKSMLSNGAPAEVNYGPNIELGLRVRTLVMEYENMDDTWDELLYYSYEKEFDFRRPYTKQ